MNRLLSTGFLNPFRLRMRRIKVLALVGKAGSGKSFRAQLVAEKNAIECIIDDGLLIRENRILGGKSAKTEQTRTSATKVSIFENDSRCSEIKEVLKREKISSVLILGISEKMIARIVERLKLPEPARIIFIEDIATEEEILTARRNRQFRGTHVIPVPVIEVKRAGPQNLIASIKNFLIRHQFVVTRGTMLEQSLVNPLYGRKGKLAISEEALGQMVMHCVQEYSRGILVKRIKIDITRLFILDVTLSFPKGVHIPEAMTRLQSYIKDHIELFTGIRISKCHLTVGQIRDEFPKESVSIGDHDQKRRNSGVPGN